MSRRSGVLSNMLDCPDEILIQILLEVNARERVALSTMCKKLNTLVFNEKQLLRDLDFSEEGYMVSPSDVRQYFTNKSKHEYIRTVNVSNVYFTRHEEVLRSICRARNLVEVNISGFKFKDFQEFGQFLEPLKQLKKLSSDWPTGLRSDSPWNKYLSGPFGRLTYLSMTVCDTLDKWTLIRALGLCLELEELYLLQTYQFSESGRSYFWMHIPDRLEKLRKVVCCGCDTGIFYTIIMEMLPDIYQWTKLYPFNNPTQTSYFYLEKDLEVAEELKKKLCVRYDVWHPSEMIGWYLRHEILLEEIALSTKHTDSKKVCFFDGCFRCYMCWFRIQDAKLLLKNPRSEILYLNLEHDMDSECDLHLITSAFPMLIKLVLSNIIRYEDLTLDETSVEADTEMKHAASAERKDSVCPSQSFKNLVDDTPRLQDLTLRGSPLDGYVKWDLAALYLITGWKNLKILFLANLPITNGQFLIEIGKQCTNLEKLRLEDLGPRHACCYKEDLLQMLGHCHNLKDFSIQQDNVNRVSDIFNALAGNKKLRRVRVESLGKKRSVEKLLLCIEKLIRSCKIYLLVCEIKGMTQFASDKLKSMLQRLKDQLNRPLFQWQILRWDGAQEPPRDSRLELAHRDLILSQRFNDAIYRMGC